MDHELTPDQLRKFDELRQQKYSVKTLAELKEFVADVEFAVSFLDKAQEAREKQLN